MAKETASIYIKLQSGDLERNIGNVAKAFRQARQEAANAKVGSAEYIAATKRVRELKGELDAHNRLLGRTGGAWSNLKTVMLGVFGGNLITGGLRAIGSALRGALDTVKAYQDANAGLNAVLGMGSEATKNLRDQQLELGASTAFTAGQVANAQTELARLGFSLTEITKMTPSVLALASAAGTDLATAAEIAGATMRGFGMESSETNRVVDVMAKSFQSSALDIGKFQIAMRQVAPVAKNANMNIEETTALLGVLIDRGVRAESAGTGLRNILGRLAQSGMTWSDAMSQINNSTDSTRTAIELFGLEASTMAIILAQNADAAGVLEGKLNDAGGAAEAMAKEQLNTLSGDLTILQSAWEGLILSVENGEGVFSRAMRGVVQGITDLIGDIQSTNEVSAQLQETLGLSYWKDGLLSPEMYSNLGEFQESLNGITKTTQEYANASEWSKIEGNIQMLRDMASVIDVTTEEGANKIKLIEAQIKNLQKIRAEAALASLPFGAKAPAEDPISSAAAPVDEKAAKAAAKAIADEETKYQKLLDLIRAEEEKLAIARLEGKAAEEAKIEAHYAKLEAQAEGHTDELMRIAVMRQQALIDLDDRLTAEQAARHEEIRLELATAALTGQEAEIQAIITHYNALTLEAQGNADLLLLIEQSKQDALTALAEQGNQERAQAALDAYNTVSNGANQLVGTLIANKQAQMHVGTDLTDHQIAENDRLAQDAARMARFQQKMAAVQNAVNASVALSGAIKGAQTLPFPANLVAMGTAVAAVLSLMGSAATLLSGAGNVPAYAKGTMSAAGGLSLVGEEGPELVNVPRGAQVFTATQTAKMMNQGGPFGSTFTGSTTPAPVPGASSATQGSSADTLAIMEEIRNWQREQRVVFEKKSYDDFSRTLDDTEKLVKYRRN